LAAAGLHRFQDLQALGAVEAWRRARAAAPRVSLNLLWALEGALTGQPWQTVARTERTRLLMMLDDAERANEPPFRRGAGAKGAETS